MDHRAFPPKIRSMSHVKRWATLPTIFPNTDDGHSFYVAFYAKMIADLIKWQGNYGDLLWEALIHDADETVVGDILGRVKRATTDSDKYQNYIDTHMAEKTPYAKSNDMTIDATRQIEAIIKAADQMDALFFAIGESMVGNKMMECRIDDLTKDLRAAWDKLPIPDVTLASLWHHVISQSIMHHMMSEDYDL